MNAPGKKLKGKSKKRKRGAGMTFGNLIRKLWQPEPKGLEPKIAPEKQRKPATKKAHSEESFTLSSVCAKLTKWCGNVIR